jgi:imidazolonepropionase
MARLKRMILTNLTLASCDSGGVPVLRDASIAVEGGVIRWVGSRGDGPAGERVDLGGRLVTPALIDCHTHIVHGGHRAGEFEMRLQGRSYAEIAAAGGGILSTLTATRAASVEALVAQALPRLDALLAEGVATVEVKSGYGLDTETERRMLQAARRLAEERAVDVVTTFLGAHAVPPEFRGRADAYLDEVCIPALRVLAAEGLVDAVDAFCEGIAFSPAQVGRVFDAARDLGLPVKLHAEQLSHQGGTALAARYGALSADHVEYATAEDAAAMAAAGTVAVLLPGAFYTLHETQRPPVAAFRAHGVPMAVSTDCNPGTSPLTSILLAMNMACTLFGLTPEEALMGVTAHAARALGFNDRGRVIAGARADLAVWDVETPAELAYRIGFNPLHARYFKGISC